MQAFICSFSDFSLAVPMDAVLSLDDASGIVSKKEALLQNTVFRDPQSGGTYVCLPLLLQFGWQNAKYDIRAAHSITLKKTGDGGSVILLSAKITKSEEIPDGEICPIPKILESTDFYALFRGIRRTEDGSPLLILDTAGLIAKVRKVAVID